MQQRANRGVSAWEGLRHSTPSPLFRHIKVLEARQNWLCFYSVPRICKLYFPVPFSVILRNRPVAMAHKDSMNQFRYTSPCYKHECPCWTDKNTNRLTIDMGWCLSRCCHGSKHVFGCLPQVSVSSYWRKIWRQKRDTHTHTHRYLFVLVSFVIAWQCELISNVLKMKYWLRRW